MGSRFLTLSQGPQPSALLAQSFLLAVPIEIRLEIYRHILSDFTREQHSDWRQREAPSLKYILSRDLHFHEPTHPLYALLFVNQSLRFEVARVLYTTCPTLKFGSPHRCLLFLHWTAPHMHLLRSLRTAVPSHETYSLEPIFLLLIKHNVPLEKLSLNFISMQSVTRRPPRKRMLSEKSGAEVLAHARLRGLATTSTFGQELRIRSCDNYGTFPRIQDLATEEAAVQAIAQRPGCSYLSQLSTLRYLETIDHPTEDWAVECELAILTLQAKMFEKAAREGKKMVLGSRVKAMREYVNVNLNVPASQQCSTGARFKKEDDNWMDCRYWIEGTAVEAEQVIPRMGVRQVETYRPALDLILDDAPPSGPLVRYFSYLVLAFFLLAFVPLYLVYSYFVFPILVYAPMRLLLGPHWRWGHYPKTKWGELLLCCNIWPIEAD